MRWPGSHLRYRLHRALRRNARLQLRLQHPERRRHARADAHAGRQPLQPRRSAARHCSRGVARDARGTTGQCRSGERRLGTRARTEEAEEAGCEAPRCRRVLPLPRAALVLQVRLRAQKDRRKGARLRVAAREAVRRGSAAGQRRMTRAWKPVVAVPRATRMRWRCSVTCATLRSQPRGATQAQTAARGAPAGARRARAVRAWRARARRRTTAVTAVIEFSQTNAESSPWWTVSLNGAFYLGTVRVTSPLAMSDVVVRAGMDPIGMNNPVCAAGQSLVPSGTVAVNCTTGLGAMYVTVFVNSSQAILSLCHVQVFALT